MTELKTRKPTGLPSWPLILLAGAEKTGKSYAAAAFSASDLIDRTFWIEVGEGSADLYGALPDARYEIVGHDGSFVDIGKQIRAAMAEPTPNKKPHAIIVDSMTEVWDLLTGEQQEVANRRRKAKPGDDAPITMDQWNTAKKRWRHLVDVLRRHNGPVIFTARLEQVSVVGSDGKPTAEKEWKIRAEKNLPFEVDAIVKMPKPQIYWLTGVRSLTLQIPPGEHKAYPEFTLDKLIRDLGLQAGTAPRHYTPPRPEAFADDTAGPEHAELRDETQATTRKASRSKPKHPTADEWTTPDPDKARRYMFKLLGDLELSADDKRDDRLALYTQIIGRPITSTKELTDVDVQQIIAVLEEDVKGQQDEQLAAMGMGAGHVD